MENNDLEKIINNNVGGIENNNDNVDSDMDYSKSAENANDNFAANATCNVDKNKTNEPEANEITEKPINAKQPRFLEKIVTSFACAVVFGLIAFLTFACADNLWGKDTTVNNSQNIVELGVTSIVEAPDGEVLSTSIPTVAKNVMPSVVSITNLSVQEVNSFFYGTQEYEYESSGSGIIIGKNDSELLLVTNNHVVEGNKSLTVTFIDGESVEAVVKGSDADIDIAVIAVKLSGLSSETIETIKVATLGESGELVVGEPSIAIGNALGYGQSVTSGIISAVERELDGFDTHLIQTDAAINPGNSGGALLNIRGEVIGINTAKVNADAVEGMGYAIPISEVKEIIEEMMNKETREKVDEEKRGKLGITCVDVDDMAAQYYNMPKGAYINEVVNDGAADRAGLSKGSIITKFDETVVSSSTSLADLLAYYKAGETVTVTVSVPKQDGTYESKNFQVTLEKAQ